MIQWNPSCEVTPFAQEKWPLKRGAPSEGHLLHTDTETMCEIKLSIHE